MNRQQHTREFVAASFFVILFFAGQNVLAEMSIKITNPTDGAKVELCSDLMLTAEVKTTTEEIKDVRFYANGKQKGRARMEPWEYNWKKILSGNYVVQAKVTDNLGVEVWSNPVHISAGDIDERDLVINGGFECGSLSQWLVNNYAGALSTQTILDDEYFDDQHYLYVAIENGGADAWNVQMHQVVPIDSGHVYSITFMADADDIKTITLAMQQDIEPWTRYISENITINGPDVYGPYEFTAQVTDPRNMFLFDLGANDIDVYLDDLRVVDLSMTSVESTKDAAPAAHELMQAYPNPFNMSTTIAYRLERTTDVNLTVYDINGRRIKELFNGRQNAGSYKIPWNGVDDRHEVPSGVYVYQLRTDERVEAKKMTLLK